MDNAPNRIWLQWHGDGTPDEPGEPDPADVTWCQDKINEHDIEYVRWNDGFGVIERRKGKRMSSIKHQSTQADAEYAALNHEFGVEHRLYLQCKHDLAAANDAMREIFPAAHRLALEIECLLLDTKDTTAVSKWWDSAHEALEQWREFCRQDAKTPNSEVTGRPLADGPVDRRVRRHGESDETLD